MPKTKSSVTFNVKSSTRTKQFRCVVKAGNGEVIFTGESCKNRRDVRKMITAFALSMTAGLFAIIDDFEAVPKKPKHYEGKLNRNWP